MSPTPATKDARASVRALERQAKALKAALDARRQRDDYLSGMLAGMAAGVAWARFAGDGFVPPLKMHKAAEAMYSAGKKLRRKRVRR